MKFLEILDGVNKATSTISNTTDVITKASQVFTTKSGGAPVNQNTAAPSGGNNGLLLLGLGLLLFGKKLF